MTFLMIKLLKRAQKAMCKLDLQPHATSIILLYTILFCYI